MSNFRWTDDETEALLNVTIEYKVLKASEGVDWESVPNKYVAITERLADLINKGMEVTDPNASEYM